MELTFLNISFRVHDYEKCKLLINYGLTHVKIFRGYFVIHFIHTLFFISWQT